MAMEEDQIEARLAELDGWKREGEGIVREFDRADFVGSIRFVEAIVEPAEEMGHHPDISISWATVSVTITSHSEGGLTENDFELARRIDELASD